MPNLVMELQTKSGGLLIVDGDDVKYWAGTGLPTYEGGSEGFVELFPEVVAEALARGCIKMAP